MLPPKDNASEPAMGMTPFRTARQLLITAGSLTLLSFAAPVEAKPEKQQQQGSSFNWSELRLHELMAQEPAATPDPNEENPNSQQELLEEAKAGDPAALAKEAQNPIASMISFPIQWNSTLGSQWAPNAIDPSAEHNRTFNVWNVQPVVPFALSKNLTLVTRTIVPVINRPLAGNTDITGIGDINPSFFFVPKTSGGLTYGFGPTLIIPSATDVRLSSQRWSAGPTGVVVYTTGPWVIGGLVNNVWSFAGEGGSDVNKMLIQPFLNYNLPKGWYLTSSPIITADWSNRDNQGWTVPIGGGIGRVFRIGKQPFNASLSAYWNVVKPSVMNDKLLGDATIRFQIQALFPTGKS